MMNVAVFGAGRIGKIHAGNLVLQPGARLKYVSDVNLQAAQELAAQHGAQVADIDSVLAATIDLKASTNQSSRIVFVASGLAAGAQHTIGIRVLGTIGRARVDVDGFVVLAQ